MQELERHLQELQVAWALHGQRLEQNRSLQQLQQRLELAEAWLASWECLLLDPSRGVRAGRPCWSQFTGPWAKPGGRAKRASTPELNHSFLSALSVGSGTSALQTRGLGKATGSPRGGVHPASGDDRGSGLGEGRLGIPRRGVRVEGGSGGQLVSLQVRAP